MENQKVLDALNSLEVFETNGGEDAYVLVKNNEENRNVLNQVGVSTETINKYGDEETFCILALAFSEGYATEYENNYGIRKLVKRSEFYVEDIDGSEFVKDKNVGKAIISHHYDFDGIYTGKIRVVYSDGSGRAISVDEAQAKFDSDEWHIIR